MMLFVFNRDAHTGVDGDSVVGRRRRAVCISMDKGLGSVSDFKL